MGKALRDLKIPIGEVLTSPTYRALETVRLARLPNPKTELATGVSDGEALVFHPDGKGGASLARIKIEEWPRLVAAR